MHFDLLEIWAKMDVFARIIVITLGLFGVACGAVFVERLWVFFTQRKASAEFGAVASRLLDEEKVEELHKAATLRKDSPLAQLIGAGLGAWLNGQKKPGGKLSPEELAKRELTRKAEELGAQTRRGMGILASVGSTAPFVGLLGTVVGIIAAFQGIATEGSGGIGAVSAGIAEALVVTALGLVVAIPAVLMFNFLNTRVDRMLLGLDRSRGELVDLLESRARSAADSGNGNRFAA
jgi:biopolymer transport protein ExbB